MSDLSDRRYLEQYLPTNFEYDQYAMEIKVNITNSSSAHEVFTNGDVLQTDKNSFVIKFPDYFTASSLFFHLTQKDEFKKEEFDFRSVSW